MPFHLELPTTFSQRLQNSDRALIGLWACSASAITAEIVAGSGCDWVLIDAEHTPNTLETVLQQLHAVSAYPVAPVVRPPVAEPVIVKQLLDLGVQNLLLPMVDTPEHAQEMAQAVSYPPNGIRGVGAALARSARWNRVDNYLEQARHTISLTVQIESATAVSNVEAIVATEGIDAIFVGPSDLAASMGYLGQQSHPEVVAGVMRAIAAGKAVGKPVGVNAFVPTDAEKYIDAGAAFVSVGADVAILARQTEALVAHFIGDAAQTERTSY